MGQDFILLESFQTFSIKEALPWLGRIVQSYRNPISGYTPVEGKVLTKEPYEDSHFSNVKMIASRISSIEARADFLGLFGASIQTLEGQSRTLGAQSVQRLRIHNDDQVLKKTLGDPEVIQRLEDWGFGIMKPTFMVVGLLIADGISYREKKFAKDHAGAHIDPAQIAGMAAGVPLLPGGTPVRTQLRDEENEGLSITAHGKRVFAVEYRVFQRKMTSRLWGPVSASNTKLRAHGPSGDRAFDLEDHLKADAAEEAEQPEIILLDESLDEFVGEDEQDAVISIEAGDKVMPGDD